MYYEELTNEELIQEYKMAVENLPGSGARGRAWIANVEKELLDRLNDSSE